MYVFLILTSLLITTMMSDVDKISHNTLCFKKTGTLFISFIIHSNDDQFTRNFYQM